MEDIKKAFEKVFADNENFSVAEVNLEDKYLIINVRVYVSNEDFELVDCPYDYRYGQTIFRDSNLCSRAPYILYRYLMNTHMFDVYNLDKYFYKAMDKGHFGMKQYLRLKETHIIITSELRRFDFFEYCDIEYDVVPSLISHYTPMKVRGVMDADPEEYDYEIKGPQYFDVPVIVSLWRY